MGSVDASLICQRFLRQFERLSARTDSVAQTDERALLILTYGEPWHMARSPDVGFTHHLIYAPIVKLVSLEGMVEFIIGGIAVVLMAWAYIAYRGRQADQALDHAFYSAIREAKATLSEDEVASLREQAAKLQAVSDAHVASGAMSRQQADRMLKQACIQSAYASIEIRRMFRA